MKTTLLSLVILIAVASCKEEFNPLTPPKDPPSLITNCQPPPIEKNIIGTWHFKTFNPENKVRTGAITFDAQKNIIDSDSLFANRIDVGGLVIAKTYDPKVVSPLPSDSRLLFVVYQVAKKGTVSTYYEVVSNECNKIRMVFGDSKIIGFELTR